MWQRPSHLPALGVVAVLVAFGVLLGVLGNRRSDLASYEPNSASHPTGGAPVAALDPAFAPSERSPATTTYLAKIELAGGIAVPNQRVSVLGPEAQLLDTLQTDSAGRLTFDIVQGYTEVQVRADFLPSLSTHSIHLPPPTDEGEVELGTIVFPGSGVVIRARGGEVFAGAPVTCGLRILRPASGLPGDLSAPLSASEAAQAYFEIPPDLDVMAFASCGSFTERSAPFTTTGLWQLVVKDFSDVCRVEVELRDVPALAAEGRIVWLEPLGETRRQDGAAPFRYEEVRAGGKVTLLGRFNASQRTTVALEIDFGPPLVLDHQPSGAWLDCSSRYLAPVEPVIAIGIVDARGELVLDRPFSVQVDKGGVVPPFHDGLHLLRDRDLEGASLLYVTLAGAGVVEAPRDSLLPLGEGIYGLVVISGASRGSLRVMAEGSVHAELLMRVHAPSGELVAVVRPDTAAEGTSWTVQSLLPGMYDLFWSWGEGELCQRAWASGV